MTDPVYHPADFLNADELCGYLAKNLEANFQINVDAMTRPEAVAHFEKRKALIIVKSLLIEEGERALSVQQGQQASSAMPWDEAMAMRLAYELHRSIGCNIGHYRNPTAAGFLAVIRDAMSRIHKKPE